MDLSKEAVARVREAEAQAAAIRSKAVADARQLRADTDAVCAEQHDERLKQVSADMRSQLDAMQATADELVRQSREEALVDAEALRETANTHMKEAVRTVVWEMFDSCQ